MQKGIRMDTYIFWKWHSFIQLKERLGRIREKVLLSENTYNTWCIKKEDKI